MERTQMLLDETLGQNPNSHLGKAVMAELTFMRGMNNEALTQVEDLLRYPGLPEWLDLFLQQLEKDIFGEDTMLDSVYKNLALLSGCFIRDYLRCFP